MIKQRTLITFASALLLVGAPALAADISDYGENAALEDLLGSGTYHVALHTGDPGETCATAELAAANGYARQGSTYTVTGSSASNDAALSFGPATADQGTVTHFSIWDDPTAGNCIAKSALGTARAWPSGTLSAAGGAFTVSID
ncbi:MAG: hypothetical protein AAGD13_00725 [Pseudomonadota bacterium]